MEFVICLYTNVYLFKIDSMNCMAIQTMDVNEAKRFSTREKAQAVINKYVDAGYGLNSRTAAVEAI